MSTMKIKTDKLTGAALSWAVAEAVQEEIGIENADVVLYFADSDGGNVSYKPWEDWAQGGPIIERKGICHASIRDGRKIIGWRAAFKADGVFGFDSPTPLIAAMRCYVASKLGAEVEIPEELIP